MFTLNGIQTLSGACQDLRHELPTMAEMGVASARLSPRAEGMAEVVAAFDAARRGALPPPTRWRWWRPRSATATGTAARAWTTAAARPRPERNAPSHANMKETPRNALRPGASLHRYYPHRGRSAGPARVIHRPSSGPAYPHLDQPQPE